MGRVTLASEREAKVVAVERREDAVLVTLIMHHDDVYGYPAGADALVTIFEPEEDDGGASSGAEAKERA